MVRSRGLVATRVLFLKPSDVSEDWEKTDLWRSAAAIPGVQVMRDDDGVEAGFVLDPVSRLEEDVSKF